MHIVSLILQSLRKAEASALSVVVVVSHSVTQLSEACTKSQSLSSSIADITETKMFNTEVLEAVCLLPVSTTAFSTLSVLFYLPSRCTTGPTFAALSYFSLIQDDDEE